MRLFLPLLMLASVAGAQTSRPAAVMTSQTETPGIAESTAMILPQISHRFVVRPQRPENPLRPGREDEEGPNNLTAGGLLDEFRGQTLARFPGIGATGWNPPDPSAAIGPTAAVQVVNSSIAFFSRTGTKTFESDFETFFASLSPGSFIFDPKVFYDWHTGRFVVCVLEEDDGSEVSKVLFAISDDSDPAGTWFKYRLEAKATVSGSTCWGDYPGFGYNKDGYAVALNLFTFSGGSFKGVEILAIKKSSVINGGAASMTTFVTSATADPDAFSLQVAETQDTTATKLYMVNSATTTKLKVWTLSGLAGTPPVPTTQLVTVPTFVWLDGSGAPSPSSRLLDDLDGRLINAQYIGGKLLTAHTTKGATDDRRLVRWYEMSVPATGGVATLAQSGEVKETSASLVHYHMGAIGKAPTGDIALIMTRSGPTGPVADIVRTMRKSSDAAGTMGAPVLLEAATGSTYGFSGFNRWGDYASVAPDPLNQRLLWGTHMTGASGTGWRTEIDSFGLSTTTTPCISAMTFSPTAGVGGGGPVTATVTTSASSASSQTVTLSSSNTTAATVPASMSIPAGSTSRTFTVTPTSTGLDTAKTTTITGVLNGVAFAKAFTVNPATLSAFTLSTTSVNATESLTGTITLNGKAGPAGRSVTVTTNTAAVYPISNPIVIASGLKTRTFTIYTKLTASNLAAVVTAALSATISRSLTVVAPPKLTTMSVSPTTVTGGTSATATATLASTVPISGLKVNFSDSSAFASMPAFASIPISTDHVDVPVTTLAVTTTKVVTLNASFNGIVKSTTLTLTP